MFVHLVLFVCFRQVFFFLFFLECCVGFCLYVGKLLLFFLCSRNVIMCLRFVKMFPHSRNLLSIIPKILGVQIVHLNYIYRESKFKTDSPKDTQTPLWLSLCTKRKFKIQVEFFHTILSLPLKKIFNRQQIIINCV